MGHYAAEMMCDKCRRCRCACPPPPDTSLSQWVVDDDFTVLKGKDYQSKHGAIGPARRLLLPHFSTKAEALAHAVQKAIAALENSRVRTEQLENRVRELLAQRP